MDQQTTANPDMAAVIQAAINKDEAAWEILIQTNQESVFRFCYLILGDGAEAADIAQDTFIHAFRALARFDPGRPLRPWLLSIAANLARNRLRSVSRYMAALRRLNRMDVQEIPNVETLSFDQIEAKMLWQAVQKLDFNDRQVIYLRFFLNMPVEETALTIQAAEGTVKSRTSRAVQRLRVVIERDFPSLRKGWRK